MSIIFSTSTYAQTNSNEIIIDGPFGYKFGSNIRFLECFKEKRSYKWENTTSRIDGKSFSDLYLLSQSYPEIQNIINTNQNKWALLPMELKSIINESQDYLDAFNVGGLKLFSENDWMVDKIKDNELRQIINNGNNIKRKFVGVYNQTSGHSILCGKDLGEFTVDDTNKFYNSKLISFLEPFEETFVEFNMHHSSITNSTRLVGLRIAVEGNDDYLMTEKVLPALLIKYGKPVRVGRTEKKWITKDGLLILFDSDCNIFGPYGGQKCIYYESLGHHLVNFQEEVHTHSLLIDKITETYEDAQDKVSTDDI